MLIPVSVRIFIIRSRESYNSLFPFSCFFLSFPAKGIIYPVCDRVQLLLSYNMNLSIYTGDNSLSEFLRKTLQCIPNETFFKKEFCFFSAFDSVNLLKKTTTDIQVVVFARKKNKDSIYNILIFYFSIICYPV